MLKWRKGRTEGESEMVKSNLAHLTLLSRANPGSRYHTKSDSNLFLPNCLIMNGPLYLFSSALDEHLDEHSQEHIAS